MSRLYVRNTTWELRVTSGIGSTTGIGANRGAVAERTVVDAGLGQRRPLAARLGNPGESGRCRLCGSSHGKPSRQDGRDLPRHRVSGAEALGHEQPARRLCWWKGSSSRVRGSATKKTANPPGIIVIRLFQAFGDFRDQDLVFDKKAKETSPTSQEYISTEEKAKNGKS
jgi:hypothetical protein